MKSYDFFKGVCDIKPLLESMDTSIFQGKWKDKRWPNTPGPFYGADTDSCGTGPIQAPYNSGSDEWDFEYIFKQPGNLQELKAVIAAAEVNVLSGYGADGNSKWTLRLIREWWKRRDELLQLCLNSRWLAEKYENSADRVERRYFQNAMYRRRYITDELASYLEAYSFFIEEGRFPTDSDTLPVFKW